MGAMIGLLVLAFVAIMMLVISYSIKNNDDDDGENMFLFGIFLLILSILVIGVLIGEDEIKHSKHKVTPVVKVECMNTKCDTTYIYSFKEEE
jgi:integral membrane sensor domain MASE1